MTNDQLLRKEYETRINRVLDYISHNLDEELTLDVLARVACFSPFHFHRIFAALAGETLGDHIRRRRLEVAASLLRDRPDQPVTEIALRCGFQSSAAFARAFRERFAMSASEWRAGGHSKNGKAERKPGQPRRNQGKDKTRDYGYTPAVNSQRSTRQRRMTMKVEIKQLPGYHVAYMRHIGPYGQSVSRHWEKFNTWAQARDLSGKGVKGAVLFGISHDDPSITPPDKCRYDACVRVPADFREEPGVNLADIPGGKYAVTAFKGTDRDIGKAWNDVFATWLPGSGYQPDDRPCFELYDDRHQCHAGGVFECDICISVRPL